MADKTLAKGLYAKQGKYGLKISIKVDEFIEFLKAHKNDKGYVNIDQNKVREPQEGKSPFYFTLDTWQPNNGKTNDTPSEPKASNEEIENKSTIYYGQDDLPF